MKQIIDTQRAAHAMQDKKRKKEAINTLIPLQYHSLPVKLKVQHYLTNQTIKSGLVF